MNTKVFAGALALSLWGGVALAQETPTTQEPLTVPEQQMPVPPEGQDVEVNVQAAPPQAVMLEEDEYGRDEIRDMRGIVTIGAGFEDYTGVLSNQINPGFQWGVRGAYKPLPYLGLELEYSGATHDLDDSVFGVASSEANGADLVRNGGKAMLTLGLGATAIQPYVLGGIGIDWYNNRTSGTAFDDDVAGVVPLGGGIRGHLGRFTADARMHYNVLFSDEFGGVSDGYEPGSYTGTLSIGGNF